MITFKGVHADKAGLVFEASPSIPVGEPRTESLVVPGRDGALHRGDAARSEVPILLEGHALETARGDIAHWLSGSGKLLFDELPDRYWMARVKTLELQTIVPGQVIRVSAGLYLEPCAYLLSGETAVSGTTSVVLKNPGGAEAYPDVKIYGSGTLRLQVDGVQTMTIDQVSDYVEIDSEADIVHRAGVSYEEKAAGTCPALPPDKTTTLSVLGSVTKIEVIPHWRSP